MSKMGRTETLKPLARVLIVKIAFTAVLCLLLLVFPPSWFVALGIGTTPPQPMVFVRLLGAAYLALLVGYSFGLAQTRKGDKPIGVVWTGAVSNGLASVILLTHGLTGAWDTWSRLGPPLMWVSSVVTLGITIGLLVYGRPWDQGAGSSKM